jgi:hypothetical protein
MSAAPRSAGQRKWAVQILLLVLFLQYSTAREFSRTTGGQ